MIIFGSQQSLCQQPGWLLPWDNTSCSFPFSVISQFPDPAGVLCSHIPCTLVCGSTQKMAKLPHTQKGVVNLNRLRTYLLTSSFCAFPNLALVSMELQVAKTWKRKGIWKSALPSPNSVVQSVTSSQKLTSSSSSTKPYIPQQQVHYSPELFSHKSLHVDCPSLVWYHYLKWYKTSEEEENALGAVRNRQEWTPGHE